MDEKKKNQNPTSQNENLNECEELAEDELLEISGGRMRNNVAITQTTDLSDDTKKNI